MAWKRKRNTAPAAASASASSSGADGPTGNVSVPGEMLTDDAVLDELSRVFAPEAAELGDADDESTVDSSTVDSWSAGPSSADPASADPASADPASADPASGRATISIVGDDLPDAAYLDDELGSDPSGLQPVFIDDDGSSDAVLPRNDSTRGIEPRIRQRRIGVKRSENRRRLWWLALGGIVMVISIAVLALLGSSLFAVDQVTVTGNIYTDQAALDAVIGDLTGTPVLLVDIGDVEARIEKIPWVEDARVRT